METTESKELFEKEGNHDVKIAVMARDIHYMAQMLGQLNTKFDKLDNSFVSRSDFESWKTQEYNELKKTVYENHGRVLLKHTISITRIMTYGTTIVSILGILEIALNIYQQIKH